jgi:2',3'-cyclic-nucleotide 2'-phosphodiesterase (5'-nucleotidase family)
MAPALADLVMSNNIQNIRVEDQLQVVEKYVNELKSHVDIFVVVSHMGYGYDQKLAEATNQIDVILGGHSHTVLGEPEIVNGVIISQAGSYGRFLGKLDLWINTDLDTIVKYRGELLVINSRNFSPNNEVQTVVDSLESIVNLDLGEVIAQLKTDWTRSDAESNIGNWIADAFRNYTNSDIAFVNSGGIRKNLEKGPVTKRDFWEISPFGNYVVVFEATGEELTKIMEHSVGGRLGSLQVSGMKMVYDPQKAKNEKVKKIFIQGKPIDKNKTYTITTLNYVYDKIVNVNKIISGDRKIKNYDLDRNILINAAKKQKVIYSQVEGRKTKVNH